MVQCLAKGCPLHVVLSPADVDGFETLLTERFEDIAKIVAGLDARDAQISKKDDRDYILAQVARVGTALTEGRVAVVDRRRHPSLDKELISS